MGICCSQFSYCTLSSYNRSKVHKHSDGCDKYSVWPIWTHKPHTQSSTPHEILYLWKKCQLHFELCVLLQGIIWQQGYNVLAWNQCALSVCMHKNKPSHYYFFDLSGKQSFSHCTNIQKRKQKVFDGFFFHLQSFPFSSVLAWRNLLQCLVPCGTFILLLFTSLCEAKTTFTFPTKGVQLLPFHGS